MGQLDQTLTTQLLTKKSASKTPSAQNYTSHCKTSEIPPQKNKTKQNNYIQPPGFLVHLTTHRITHPKIFMMSTSVLRIRTSQVNGN